MVNFAHSSPDEQKRADELLSDLVLRPDKITKDMFLELSDWEEERNEDLGYRLKKRQGVIGGVLDSAGDNAVIVASFFRLYPLEKGQKVPESSVAHIRHIIRSDVNRIIEKYSQKYKNIVIVTLPTPSWMEEE